MIRCGPRPVAAVLLAVPLALAVAALTPAGPVANPPAASAQPEPRSPGALLYLRDCAWCHGAAGEGTTRGTPLIGVGEASASFYLTTGRMPIPDPDFHIRRQAPAYSPEEIRTIVDHVVALGGGPASPAVDPGAGDLVAGGQLYLLHCAACHGAGGAGFPLLGGRNSPSVWRASAREVAESIRIGPGGMPPFSPETLTDEEVNSVVRYVLYLQNPDDRGGFHLFRVGPLTEGLVAWGVGIALLLVAARLLGSRA